jgi:hypothetical protein
MKTPALVVAAVLVEPVWAGPVLVQPHTLRRHMKLSDVQSPLLWGAPTQDIAAIVQAVRIFDTRWPELDETAFCKMVRPRQVPGVVEAIRASITLGWATSLGMIEPPTPGQRSSRPGRDRFGTATRLWAYAVQVLHLAPDAALDMPLCQLNVLAATSEALSGKVPAGDDYFDLSESIAAGQPVSVHDSPDPQRDGRQDQGRSDHDAQPQQEPASSAALPHLPEAGEEKIHRGRHTS